MPNERLRTAMLERGISPADLAESLRVDPKSVERWISGRTPYRRHRYAVAARLGLDEVYLWPDALSADQVASASESEINEARQEFSVVFTARPIGGTPTPSDESTEVRWVPPAEIATLPMDRSMRMRIDHYLTAPLDTHLG